MLNRGVRRLRLFDNAADYRAFLDVFGEAQARTVAPFGRTRSKRKPELSRGAETTPEVVSLSRH